MHLVVHLNNTAYKQLSGGRQHKQEDRKREGVSVILEVSSIFGPSAKILSQQMTES